YWIAPDSKKTINDQFEKPNKVPIPKTKISLYGKYDAFVIPRTASICRNLKNIGFETGHFGMLYNMKVIKYFYNYVFKK
ncbi:MAG: hypothetical protein ABH828_00005, partial [archaeon]